jgi:hypothetical protein
MHKGHIMKKTTGRWAAFTPWTERFFLLTHKGQDSFVLQHYHSNHALQVELSQERELHDLSQMSTTNAFSGHGIKHQTLETQRRREILVDKQEKYMSRRKKTTIPLSNPPTMKSQNKRGRCQLSFGVMRGEPYVVEAASHQQAALWKSAIFRAAEHYHAWVKYTTEMQKKEEPEPGPTPHKVPGSIEEVQQAQVEQLQTLLRMQTDACEFAQQEARRLQQQLDTVYKDLSTSTNREARLLEQLNQQLIVRSASPTDTNTTSGDGTTECHTAIDSPSHTTKGGILRSHNVKYKLNATQQHRSRGSGGGTGSSSDSTKMKKLPLPSPPPPPQPQNQQQQQTQTQQQQQQTQNQKGVCRKPGQGSPGKEKKHVEEKHVEEKPGPARRLKVNKIKRARSLGVNGLGIGSSSGGSSSGGSGSSGGGSSSSSSSSSNNRKYAYIKEGANLARA